MKPYLFVISLVLFFSFSINAQTNKKVNKKVTTTQQKVPKQKAGQIGYELDSLPPWVKNPGKNTPQTRGVQSNISGTPNNQGQIRGQRRGNIQKKPGGSGLYRDSLPWVKAPGKNAPQTRGGQSNTNGSTLPFKGTDEELQAIQSRRQRNGTNNVVDHKSDDQKLQGTQSRRRLNGANSVVDHKSDDQKIQTRGNRNANQNRGTRNVNRQKKGGGQNVVMSGGSTMIKKGGGQNRNGKNLKQGNVRNTAKRKRKNN